MTVTFEHDDCFAEAKGLSWNLGGREGNGMFKVVMTLVMMDEANMSRFMGCHKTPLRTSATSDLATLQMSPLKTSSRNSTALSFPFVLRLRWQEGCDWKDACSTCAKISAARIMEDCGTKIALV